jgi:hypothetical protein
MGTLRKGDPHFFIRVVPKQHAIKVTVTSLTLKREKLYQLEDNSCDVTVFSLTEHHTVLFWFHYDIAFFDKQVS